ncbi:gamma-aminobutyric acid receptor subunit gamma-3-like isoform X1 [Hirundo rustica]|uniref:gamma-aminobutyric acid receptor subunit gamma-3-like isoform X1 n=1 Tax=Hirundo rustica TaxID=43150 RepID=UPI001A9456A4|nr:gamma-aminobutyric acid receptor subunit gamma-3-like isoform X1 [Hirundo rustica]
MSAKLLPVFFLLSVFHACSRKVEEDEYEDGTTNQKWVLAPKTQDTDVTLILNKLLREYDKKLRPDIGIKPTVIDVDIYVNSIGPVSSINMPKVPVKTVWKKQNKCDIAWGTAREEGQKWLDTILRSFHKTAMLFLTSWPFSSREITKFFKRRILEAKFHNLVEYRKAQVPK